MENANLYAEMQGMYEEGPSRAKGRLLNDWGESPRINGSFVKKYIQKKMQFHFDKECDGCWRVEGDEAGEAGK